MDPIDPIVPGALPISRAARTPVEPVQRITRDRDRPAKEDARERPREHSGASDEQQTPPEDDGHPHIDVRV
jgi:hypothetical protein